MGLLDNLYFGHRSNFGGQNGGLLDFLRNTQMQQDQYQPSGGFAPMLPPPQPETAAQPIQVGGLQMPRIGGADQFDPAQVNLPPNSQPTSGQMPQPMQQPDIGFGDRIGAGLMNFANAGGLLPALAGGLDGLMTGHRSDRVGNANQTAQFLVSKGIDPALAKSIVSDPATLRSVLPQIMGSGHIQSLGNGYIAQNGKITRVYEPDDKTPIGFRKTANGLEAIPGGPADPAYLRVKTEQAKDPNAVHALGRGGELYRTGPDGNPIIIHKNEGEDSAVLDDQTTAAMAAQYLAGDRTVMQNLGRGAQGAANVVKLRNEIYKQAQSSGLSGRDIVDNFNEQAGALSGQRAVGTRAANISLAANEANNMIPIALAASDKLPRSQYMPWNQMVQAVQKGSSSPELASFVAATNSLVNSYVRAVSPSGVPTDSMREHAYSMLNAAQGPEAYKAVISTMKQEMQAALEAPTQVRKELRHKPEDPAPTQPARSSKTKTGISWSVE